MSICNGTPNKGATRFAKHVVPSNTPSKDLPLRSVIRLRAIISVLTATLAITTKGCVLTYEADLHVP